MFNPNSVTVIGHNPVANGSRLTCNLVLAFLCVVSSSASPKFHRVSTGSDPQGNLYVTWTPWDAPCCSSASTTSLELKSDGLKAN